ncbi:hypothetical protein J437_LFUL016569 [Ladona fulva]|uniref:Kringle domain-containing protein n=1 Tax=Ladona fulva TaxID=123851 RepID=A0A8K0KPM8_LADFU|nr:hypothetical protein J437_LFUL016569 [Ladona fulva]
MTDGTGMSFGSKYVWMWDETQFAFTYTNWWKGWKGNAEEIMDRTSKCMVASRKFPCLRREVSSEEMVPRRTQISGQQTLLCKTDYFFWSPQDCNALTEGAICKKLPMDIGCVWNLGMDYTGKANITASGKPCVHWKNKQNNSADEQLLCRNKRGADGGGAVEGHPWCYVDQIGTWEECEIPPCQYRGLSAEL